MGQSEVSYAVRVGRKHYIKALGFSIATTCKCCITTCDNDTHLCVAICVLLKHKHVYTVIVNYALLGKDYQ